MTDSKNTSSSLIGVTGPTVAVEGTPILARAAQDAGVTRLVHVSTAAVYDRSPGVGDVGETSPLVNDDAGDYAVTKRDTDAALAEIDGLTCILLRPPAILGDGETSIWNSLRPAAMREHQEARRTIPERTFAWVHVDDLAALAADVASGRIRTASDAENGPVEGACKMRTSSSCCTGSRCTNGSHPARVRRT